MQDTQKPTTLLCEEEEKQKQEAKLKALEEIYHGSCIFTAGIRKLIEAEGKVFKKKEKTI